MELRDYNGLGRWSALGIQSAYAAYSRQLGIAPATDLSPMEARKGDVRWVYPVMEKVIDGIEAGDPACIALGVDFLEARAEPGAPLDLPEEDRLKPNGRRRPNPHVQRFAFGRILKSNTARALRRAPLNEEQVERIRARIVGMLIAGDVPHEFQQYARLLRRVGVGPHWPALEQHVNRNNPYVMRYFRYLRNHPIR